MSPLHSPLFEQDLPPRSSIALLLENPGGDFAALAQIMLGGGDVRRDPQNQDYFQTLLMSDMLESGGDWSRNV